MVKNRYPFRDTIMKLIASEQRRAIFNGTLTRLLKINV
jgi:hypothetical protein